MQQLAISRDYDSQYPNVPALDAALDRADAAAYGQRWGAKALLDAASDHYDKLCAMYGPKRDVTEFPTFLVLRRMTMATEQKRLQDWASHWAQVNASARQRNQ